MEITLFMHMTTGDSRVSLDQAGWNRYWEELYGRYQGPYLPGRVSTVHKTRYEVIIPDGSVTVPVSGALRKRKTFPVVGDFVVLLHQPESAVMMIVAILPRKTSLSRGGAGESAGEQLLAANIDTVFIITDSGPDLSIPRLERYLLITRQSGARPVIILNKSDTCGEINGQVMKVTSEIPDVPVIALSAREKTGLDQLSPFLAQGSTVVILGSSGVGKSTLMNALAGTDLMKTGEIREDDGRGRHTTTTRHLLPLPEGYSLIDTPGLREIRVWTAGEGLSEAYGDIHELASGCRFSDCTHGEEPGCAGRQAVAEGKLHPDRLERYHKILKEIAFERDKADIGLKRFEKKRYREISRTVKEMFDTQDRKGRWG